MTSEPAIFPHLLETIPFPREQARMRRIEVPKPSSSIFYSCLILNYLTFIRSDRVSIPKTADVYGVPTLPLGIVSIVTVAAGYAVIRTPDPSLVVFRNSLSMPRPGNQAYGAENTFLPSEPRPTRKP
jgi:hypothetical protein